MQPRTPLIGHNAGRMVWESGEDGHIVAHPCPVMRQLGSTRCRRSHLRGEILRNVENLHGVLTMAFNYDSEVCRPKQADLKNATPPAQMWSTLWSQFPRETEESLLRREGLRQKLPIRHDDLCSAAREIETLASVPGQRVPAGGNPPAQPPRHLRRLRPALSNTTCPHLPNN